MEDRPVPENVQQILWAGGQREFRWRDVPRLTFDLRRVIKEIKPDLIHAGPDPDLCIHRSLERISSDPDHVVGL